MLKLMSAVVVAISLTLPVHAAPLKVCVGATGKITARTRCGSRTAPLTLSSITVQGPQGPAGVSDIRISDSSIATLLNSCSGGFPCFFASKLTREAPCPSGTLVLKSYCITKATNAPTPTLTESSDGTRVTCEWVNATIPWHLPGQYYARAICVPAPPL